MAMFWSWSSESVGIFFPGEFTHSLTVAMADSSQGVVIRVAQLLLVGTVMMGAFR